MGKHEDPYHDDTFLIALTIILLGVALYSVGLGVHKIIDAVAS